MLESAKMITRVDPSIRLLAAAHPDLDWTLDLLRTAGDFIDLVSIHGYYDGLRRNDMLSSYMECVMRSDQPADAIRHGFSRYHGCCVIKGWKIHLNQKSNFKL